MTNEGRTEVAITEIELGMGTLMTLMLKMTIASIPAAIIAGGIIYIILHLPEIYWSLRG